MALIPACLLAEPRDINKWNARAGLFFFFFFFTATGRRNHHKPAAAPADTCGTSLSHSKCRRP